MREIEKITSRDNRRLIHARKVRDGRIPEQIFIEGRRLVEECLRSKIAIDECFFVDGSRDRELLDAITVRAVSVVELPEKLIGSIVDTDQPQGLVLIAKRPNTGASFIESRIGSAALPVTIFLKEINNPSNLGAIMRTAEAAGVAGVIISNNSADVFSPKALRSAMGASFRVPVWNDVDFDDVLRWARERELTVTASDISATKHYDQIDWKTPRLLIFGSEAHGLSGSELDSLDEKILIPMENDVESLNLAVSAGIILFEAKRQNS